ncbi:MAG: hypothetical protein HQL88_03030 [Magnetococcales bacterium]|nr:hypothetical protein [Magnetococcales bacterium]
MIQAKGWYTMPPLFSVDPSLQATDGKRTLPIHWRPATPGGHVLQH